VRDVAVGVGGSESVGCSASSGFDVGAGSVTLALECLDAAGLDGRFGVTAATSSSSSVSVVGVLACGVDSDSAGSVATSDTSDAGESPAGFESVDDVVPVVLCSDEALESEAASGVSA